MRPFRDWSLRQKLLAAGMLASTTALAAASAAFLLYDVVAFRDALVRRLQVQARIVGANCVSALLFQDEEAAATTLSGLAADAPIEAAGVYDGRGALFARYLRPGARQTGLPERVVLEPRQLLDRGGVRVVEPVAYEGRRIGAVVIDSSLQALAERVRRYVTIVGLVFATSVVLALVISAQLQRVISRPVLQLARVARIVSQEQNYAIRAPEAGRDDMGLLVRTFNEMLDRIQRRDVQLQEARDELERRVELRTVELRQANEKLEASNRELQDFASVASHDLQEPLRKIHAFSSRLAARSAEALGEEGRDDLRRMQNAVTRMQTLIDDLLALSRVSTRGRPLVPVELDAIVRDVLSDMEPRIENTGARIEVAPLPTIDADPTQMRQLLQNLLGNALKFVRPGVPPVVRIRSAVADGRVELRVEDNGIGFEQRYAERIFTVFQRLQGRTEYEGTGIGLAICRRIAERHGGSITAEGRPGQGATFVVTLPLRHREEEAALASAGGPPGGAP